MDNITKKTILLRGSIKGQVIQANKTLRAIYNDTASVPHSIERLQILIAEIKRLNNLLNKTKQTR